MNDTPPNIRPDDRTDLDRVCSVGGNEMDMTKPTIKELVAGERHVVFSYYRQGVFYYTAGNIDGDEWLFPVPINDIGTATLLKADKAITFMRWIRKALEEGTLIRVKK